uniref:Uncharacterized protein n=1 Tax=Oryza brachyantha TaxID=4533 RepID=J3MRX1_ORYBR
MANEQYDRYDADGDVTRYLLDPTTEIAMFSEPVAAVTVPITVESCNPVPATHVEQPTQVIHANPSHAADNSSGNNLLPVEQDANMLAFRPLLPGQLNCSCCHLVRHVMHTTYSRTIHFFVHSTAPGSFEHAIVDRAYTGAHGQITMEEQLYFDLSKHTEQWASNFIASNIQTMRDNTSGELVDSGYTSFVDAAVRANENDNPHTGPLEVDSLQTIVSTPSSDHHNTAAPPAESPRAAASSKKAPKAEDYARLLLAIEEFHVAATIRPIPKSDIEILESSYVAQQAARDKPIMYPSMRARKSRKQVVLGMRARDVIDYVHRTRKETEKEINTLSSFGDIFENDGMLTYMMKELRRLKKKIWRYQTTVHITMTSTMMGSLKMDIDDLRVEKARAYAQFMKCVKDVMRKKGHAASIL